MRALRILGLQPCDKAVMLDDNTIEFFLRNLYEMGFPEERNAFVRVIRRGRHDVTCKPAM